MIVLDANVLIAYFDRTDAHHLPTLRLLDAFIDEGFCSNAVTVAESLIYPTIQGTQRQASTSLEQIGLQIQPLLAESTMALAGLRADLRIRMPDAIVLHTALENGARLATFDRALAAAAGKVGVETVGPVGAA